MTACLCNAPGVCQCNAEDDCVCPPIVLAYGNFILPAGCADRTLNVGYNVLFTDTVASVGFNLLSDLSGGTLIEFLVAGRYQLTVGVVTLERDVVFAITGVLVLGGASLISFDTILAEKTIEIVAAIGDQLGITLQPVSVSAEMCIGPYPGDPAVIMLHRIP